VTTAARPDRQTAARRRQRAAVGGSFCATVFVLTVGAAALPGQKDTPGPRLSFERCRTESVKLFGREPVRIGPDSKVKAPKKLRNASPRFPRGARRWRAGFSWVGEVLIGVDGKVRGVWAVKEIEFSPPWPEFNAAVEAAVKQWVFEPTEADGRPVPICMAVSVGVNPR